MFSGAAISGRAFSSPVIWMVRRLQVVHFQSTRRDIKTEIIYTYYLLLTYLLTYLLTPNHHSLQLTGSSDPSPQSSSPSQK